MDDKQLEKTLLPIHTIVTGGHVERWKPYEETKDPRLSHNTIDKKREYIMVRMDSIAKDSSDYTSNIIEFKNKLQDIYNTLTHPMTKEYVMIDIDICIAVINHDEKEWCEENK